MKLGSIAIGIVVPKLKNHTFFFHPEDASMSQLMEEILVAYSISMVDWAGTSCCRVMVDCSELNGHVHQCPKCKSLFLVYTEQVPPPGRTTHKDVKYEVRMGPHAGHSEVRKARPNETKLAKIQILGKPDVHVYTDRFFGETRRSLADRLEHQLSHIGGPWHHFNFTFVVDFLTAPAGIRLLRDEATKNFVGLEGQRDFLAALRV